MEAFREIAKKDFREAYRLFNDKCFPEMMEKADNRQKALFMQGFLISLSPIRIWKNFCGLKGKGTGICFPENSQK